MHDSPAQLSGSTSAAVPTGPRFWWALVAALLLGVVSGAAALTTFRPSNPKPSAEHIAALVQAQNKLLAEQAAGDALRAQLLIEQSTVKGLESTLQAVQADLSNARDKLAFFEKLLPPGPQGAISIRAFDVEYHDHLLRYRLLLQRNAAGDNVFNGTMYFKAQGTQDGVATTVTLQAAKVAPANVSPIDADEAINNFELHFEQFNRSAGWLMLPPDFVPKSLSVYIQEGKTLRVSRKVDIALP